jgi:hypothetical protein
LISALAMEMKEFVEKMLWVRAEEGILFVVC